MTYNYKYYISKHKCNKIKQLLNIDKNTYPHHYENYLLNWFSDSGVNRIKFPSKKYKKAIKILRLIFEFNKIEKSVIEVYYNYFLKNGNNTEFNNEIIQTFISYMK